MAVGQTTRQLSRLVPGNSRFTMGEALTLAFSYFTTGFAVSVLHVTEGSSPLTVVGAALIVNSATSTLAYAAVLTSGGSFWSGVLSGWLVATRFGLFAAAIGPRLWPERWKRAISSHLAFDPSVALAQREPTDEGVRRVFLASGLWLCIPWWTAAAVGAFVGGRFSDSSALGLDAVLPAMLLAIVWRQLADGWQIAALASIVALALVDFTPGGVPVLVAGLAALLALRPTRSESR